MRCWEVRCCEWAYAKAKLAQSWRQTLQRNGKRPFGSPIQGLHAGGARVRTRPSGLDAPLECNTQRLLLSQRHVT